MRTVQFLAEDKFRGPGFESLPFANRVALVSRELGEPVLHTTMYPSGGGTTYATWYSQEGEKVATLECGGYDMITGNTYSRALRRFATRIESQAIKTKVEPPVKVKVEPPAEKSWAEQYRQWVAAREAQVAAQIAENCRTFRVKKGRGGRR